MWTSTGNRQLRKLVVKWLAEMALDQEVLS